MCTIAINVESNYTEDPAVREVAAVKSWKYAIWNLTAGS